MTPWQRGLLAAVCLFAAAVRAASAGDLDLLGQAHWGMTTAQLDAAFGEDLTTLPGRWDYGPRYADRMLPGVTVGGHDFRAFFQMDRRTDRLSQVLLERRSRDATPRVFDDVIGALTERYGEPDETASEGDQAVPVSVRVVWNLPELSVQASFFDYYTTGMVFEDPNTNRNPLVPYAERRRNNPRFLPRRALIRLTPPETADAPSGPVTGS